MSKSHRHAGRFNLRGKKEIMLSCKCCCVTDLREKLLKPIIRKEVAEESRSQ